MYIIHNKPLHASYMAHDEGKYNKKKIISKRDKKEQLNTV